MSNSSEIEALADSELFRDHIKEAIKMDPAHAVNLARVLRKAAQGKHAIDSREVAGALDVPVGRVQEILGPLVAIISTDEFRTEPEAAAARLSKRLSLTAANRKRLERILAPLKTTSASVKSYQDLAQERRELVGDHLPTWRRIVFRIFYAVDQTQYGTGELQVLPVCSIRLHLEGADGKEVVAFQADDQDLGRLADAIESMRDELDRAHNSIRSQEPLRLATDGAPPPRKSKTKATGKKRKRSEPRK